jgi:alpha-tubulin suppressor-like RCC1 family protein
VDLTSFNGNGQQYDEHLFNQLSQTMGTMESPASQYLMKVQEKIVQLACGSIHTLARSTLHRIFSCGNGSTFALGHKTKDTCSSFKQVEFFNGSEEGVSDVQVKTIACGLGHSGCVLEDGSVFLWGIVNDF